MKLQSLIFLSLAPSHVIASSLTLVPDSTNTPHSKTISKTHVTTLVLSTDYSFATALKNLHDRARLAGRVIDALFPKNSISRRNIPNSDFPTAQRTGSDPNSVQDCWLSSVCNDVWSMVQQCYEKQHGMTNPYDITQIDTYRGCICDWESGEFKALKSLQTCHDCFFQTGVTKNLTDILTNNFHDFCSTSIPSLWLFLHNLIFFAGNAYMPTKSPPLHGALTQIATFFSYTIPSGANQPQTTSFSQSSFNSWLLRQLPEIWPYTKYGEIRVPGRVLMVTLTDPLRGTPEAVAVATVQWYPRPFGRETRWDNKVMQITESVPVTSMVSTMESSQTSGSRWTYSSGEGRVGSLFSVDG